MTPFDWVRVAGYALLAINFIAMGATLFPSRTERNIGRMMGLNEYAGAAFFVALFILVVCVRLGVPGSSEAREVILPVIIYLYLATKVAVTLCFQKPSVKGVLNGNAKHTD